MPIERPMQSAVPVKWDVKMLLQEIEDLAFINNNTAMDIESNIVGTCPQEDLRKQ